MPKIKSFLLKNRKTHPALGALPPDLHIRLTSSWITRWMFITAAFVWHKEKDGNIIILVSKSAAAVVADINYCKLRRHTLCMTFWNHLCFEKFGEGGPLSSFLGGGKGGIGWSWSDSECSLQCHKFKTILFTSRTNNI